LFFRSSASSHFYYRSASVISCFTPNFFSASFFGLAILSIHGVSTARATPTSFSTYFCTLRLSFIGSQSVSFFLAKRPASVSRPSNFFLSFSYVTWYRRDLRLTLRERCLRDGGRFSSDLPDCSPSDWKRCL